MSQVSRCSPYSLIEVDDALSLALSEASHRELIQVQSKEAFGFVAAENIYAKSPFPPFKASLKDGYAVRHPLSPGKKQLVGTVITGRSKELPQVNSEQAAYITTGAPLPPGADSVIPVEWTAESGDPGFVMISRGTHVSGQEVRQIGSDIPEGELIISDGSHIGVTECALLINCGVERVQVYKRPKVAVFSTGNELVEIGNSLSFGEIYDANRPLVIAALRKMDIEIVDLGIVRDDEVHVREAFERALKLADIIITSGGVSMGSHDYVKKVLERLGKVHFGRVRMKPGKPLTFATVESENSSKRFVVGLPGNPVSCYVCFYLLVVPLIRKLSGYSKPHLPIIEAELLDPIRLDPERPEYHRSILQWNFERHIYQAKSTGDQSSSRLLSATKANALLILPSENKTLERGTLVPAILLECDK
ncbi:molybdopterin biosynthesis protein MoeA [Galdieria sulphuraria]|uniref:Molybdopterin biosynthesis protein MoeA n=1 Tax=Galdieria sulphuraria TaxID=130081 RepID=M2XPM1_GALSU|nr:molybdopterin biosynthesis protein MoeA [Galdieria sulphuraria]EME32162.1 molybdopterin biosynthesis protein MoeA [Galdieria sulphuraria]|eukprot:XP_005708682.1 molybdopterin biosynthesis protein MoeA [Galdieria sulphuraria]